jgi:endo-1,4-beta-xylanase
LSRLPDSTSKTDRRELLKLGVGALAVPALLGCGLHRVGAGTVLTPPVMGIDGDGSLKAHGALHGLLVGCAVSVRALEADTAYAELIKAQASILVAENEMKWAPLRPTFDTYDFDRADKLVAFAEANRIKIRGHNLCWHRQLPKWFEAQATTTNARQLLLEHIDTVAGRYAGRMHSWDVVNEAVLLSDGRADGLRDSPWLRLVGPDYIEQAFRRVRAADPTALLCYNEYGIEGEDAASEQKRIAVLLLLRRLVARKIPIDAVGVQSHISVGEKHVYGEGLLRFLSEVRELDLQVFVTEMDVNDRELQGDEVARDEAVAAVYRDYLDSVLTDPGVRAVMTWGITDKYTWLNSEGARKDHLPERCLPFDGEYKATKAFFAMRDAIDGR